MAAVNERILPPATIGIIGGGQLGRMTALAARAMGYRIVVLEPKKPCACTAIVDEQISSAYDDPEGLERLFAVSDVVTFEFENVQREPLERFQGKKPIRPSAQVLSIAQNRRREKEFLESSGFPVAPFRLIENVYDVDEVTKEGFAFPAILKTADFGYDGKGQKNVESASKLAEAWAGFDGASAVLEEKIEFSAEYSVIAVRSPSGEVVVYPLCQNIHRNHILDVTFSPPIESLDNAEEAEAISRRLVEELQLEGVLVIEFFLTNDGKWIINEMAPRPHNSGHFSLDGSVTSQFENHARAVCNLPLGSPQSLGSAAMQNLLGQDLRKAGESLAESSLSGEGSHLHLYDKGEASTGRKMGHINLLASDPAVLDRQVNELRERLGLPRLRE